MKVSRNQIISAVVAGSVLLGGGGAYAATTATLASVKDAAQSEIASTYAQLDAAVEQTSAVTAERELAYAEIADLTAQIEILTAAQNNLETEISGLNNQIAGLNSELDDAVIGLTAATANRQYAFTTFVANTGGQEAVDKCTGGLTNNPEIGDYLAYVESRNKVYYPIHNHCGGRPILSLGIGDLVQIKDVGDYIVVETRDVQKGDDATVIEGLPGGIVLQTCHDSGSGMRAVSLVQI